MTELFGLVLAGGLSRRMGENKVLLPFGPGRLIDHVIARLTPQCKALAVNANQPIPNLHGVPVIADDIAGFAGPLAGIAAGLRHMKRDDTSAAHLLTVAVDTPFFPTNLSQSLLAAASSPDEIIVATDGGGRWHPAFALWPLSVEEDLRDWLTNPENRKVRTFIERHPHRSVTFPLIEERGRSIEPFFNINTPEDYQRALSLLDDKA